MTPLTISAAAPALVTIRWPAEPANVSLESASVELTPHQSPRTPIGQTPSPPATPPAPLAVVKSIPLGTPTAGSTSQVSLDGTGNAAGVVPPVGLYDVVVVREVSVASTCESFTAGGPTSTVLVTTTIGHVRLP